MYKTLWNGMSRQMSKSHASALFLAVLLIGWTAAGFVTGSVVCMVGGMSAITKITIILCCSGYSGLIFGFFGGILYLYRTGSRYSSEEAHTSVVSANTKMAFKTKTVAYSNPLK